MLQEHAIILLEISSHEPYGGILYEHDFSRDGRNVQKCRKEI